MKIQIDDIVRDMTPEEEAEYLKPVLSPEDSDETIVEQIRELLDE